MPLTAGTRLGPYEILSLLGTGGMGEVYKAHDPRLGRDAAIKVLPESVAADPARLYRFEQEARAVAALSHPNILAIFDIGAGERPYLVTELLDGETLRAVLAHGPLSLARATDVALQLIAGLYAAHGRGIIHRDLKPENIFLVHDRVVKILDFGLAKTTFTTGEPDVDVTRTSATTPGLLLGTAGYMSPEQVRGHAADRRSDIFGVGAILFEMITGQRAFQGDSPVDTMSAVLREQSSDLVLRSGLPPAVARVVRRCLEKDPDDRFQSVGDLQFAIESISDFQPAPAAPAKKTDEKSIAVLPFANMSADAENRYFSDGLAEELINALTRLPGLQVASRTSAFRFRGHDVDIRDIGRQLQVTTVLEGSVRRAGNRLRITAQLINIADGYHLWSERYDREIADVFTIQDEIVEAIVKALAPALVGDAKNAVPYTFASLDAYNAGQPALYTRSVGNPLVSDSNLQMGMYIQDDVRVSKGLTLSPGVRYSRQTLVSDSKAFEPRFGVTWAPTTGGKTTLRASAGIFHGWLWTGIYEQTLRLNGVRQRDLVVINPAYPDPGAAGVVAPSNKYLLGNVGLQRNVRYSAGIDQTVSRRLRVNLLYNFIDQTQLPRGLNMNAPVDGMRPDPASANVIATVTDAELRRHELFANVNFNLSPQAQGASGAKFDARRVTAVGSFSLIRARRNADGPFDVPPSGTLSTEWGPGPADMPYRFNVSVNSTQVRNLAVNLSLTASDGNPYTLTTGRDDNQDGIINDRPAGVGLRSLRTTPQWYANVRVTYTLTPGSAPGAQAASIRYKLGLFVNVTNLTNHTNLTGFSGVMTSPFFLKPTSATNPRKFDFGTTVSF